MPRVNTSIDRALAKPGEQVELRFNLQGDGSQVSGLQFDIDFPPELVVSPSDIILGAAAQTAGKSVSQNMMDNDTLRVLVAGLNQTAIPDGVLARLPVAISPGATGKSLSLRTYNESLTNPAGAGLPVSLGGSASLVIDAATSPPPPPPTTTGYFLGWNPAQPGTTPWVYEIMFANGPAGGPSEPYRKVDETSAPEWEIPSGFTSTDWFAIRVRHPDGRLGAISDGAFWDGVPAAPEPPPPPPPPPPTPDPVPTVSGLVIEKRS